jgi:hypothetical protein
MKTSTVVVPSLDGSRAVSFLLVFVSHARSSFFRLGPFGVSVFFFFSGHLITTLLRIENDECETISLRNWRSVVPQGSNGMTTKLRRLSRREVLSGLVGVAGSCISRSEARLAATFMGHNTSWASNSAGDRSTEGSGDAETEPT